MILKRKIRTAEESMEGAVMTLAFAAVWYGSLIRVAMTAKQNTIFIFFIVGILPVYTGITIIRRALYYRKLHREYKKNPPSRGKIAGVVKELKADENSNRRTRRSYYYLLIDVGYQEGFNPVRIKSDAYSFPVHEYLASPYVEVYDDKSGWHHAIDGFQLKRRKKDPGILLENGNVPEKEFHDNNNLVKIVWIMVLIYIIYQILFS